MALATQRVSAPSSGFAVTANTRLGDGVRASSATSAFMPVPPTEAMPEILLQDQGLRNDNWARRETPPAKTPEPPPSANGRVFFRTVFMSNADAQVLFKARFETDEDGVQDPASETDEGSLFMERATGTYETNTRLLAAAYRGQPLRGSDVDRVF